MSSAARHPGELLDLVAEYRHVRAAHRATKAGGAARRHLARRLAALDSGIERALSVWVLDEAEREAWRRHLRHGGPAPEPPRPVPPPVYRGTAEDGSAVEIRPGPGGAHHLFVDGEHRGAVEPVPEVLPPGGMLLAAGMACQERHTASAEALAALRAHVAAGTGPPPWRWAAELVADGLVDPDFGLTARGRRALAAGGER